MDLSLMLTRLLNSLKKKKKENLLTGSFLLIAAIISVIPGSIHLITGIQSLPFSILTVSQYISVLMFSLLMIAPAIILFSTAYLLSEGHSLGWKISIATCAIALLIAITSTATINFALPIALLSGLAATLQILNVKRFGNQTKDSPVAMENVVKLGLRLSALFSVSVVVAMFVYVVIEASPFLSVQLFTSMNLNYHNIFKIVWGLHPPIGSAGGVLCYALGQLLVVAFCELVAIPIGICAAIYLAEYSSQNRIVSTIRFFIETLAGSPSIVIAIVGWTIFTLTLRWDWCLWGAAIALSFMALPWNIRVAEESMKSVPRSYREASFALGASQWQTASQITLYAASPGIITGILLGIGVALGETLILLWNYSSSAIFGFPSPWWKIFDLHQPLPSITVFIQQSVTTQVDNIVGTNPGGGTGANVSYVYCLAFAAGLVLLVIYLIICIGALLLRNHLNKRMKGS